MTNEEIKETVRSVEFRRFRNALAIMERLDRTADSFLRLSDADAALLWRVIESQQPDELRIKSVEERYGAAARAVDDVLKEIDGPEPLPWSPSARQDMLRKAILDLPYPKGQPMIAQPTPSWAAAAREAAVQVDETIRSCVGFVGYMSENGLFTANGTGFFVCIEDEEFRFVYFVTARHVIWPHRKPDDQAPDTAIGIRLNVQSGGHRTLRTNTREWIFPDDYTVDIGIYPFDESIHDSDESLQVSQVDLKTMALRSEVMLSSGICTGDEVFIAGLFTGRTGTRKNIPVIRIGNIAAMPEEPIDFASPRHPAYLIETRSLGGTSGSPVFLNLRQFRTSGPLTHRLELTDRNIVQYPYFLIGMIIWSHGGSYQTDFLPSTDEPLPKLLDSDFNAGISIALPIQLLIDLLESEKMKTVRSEAVSLRRQRSGARPSSASQSHIISN